MANDNMVYVPALAISQSRDKVIYSFGIDGKVLIELADISHIGRDEDGKLKGYQRHQVRKHIQGIRDYIESESPMIPNAVVIAFSPQVTFVPLEDDDSQSQEIRMGHLHIPQDSEDQVAWVVDGQQRLTAVKEASITAFNLCAVGFVAETEGEHREQFILVNNSKPLPKSLIYEMLPDVDAKLPAEMEARNLSMTLVTLLNHTPDSPLHQVVQLYTNREGRLKDTSLLKSIENSVSNGALYYAMLECDDDEVISEMYDLLSTFWAAVSRVWSDIWDLPPRKSRLLHGVGVQSLSFLMDSIYYRYHHTRSPTTEDFEYDLELIKDQCFWHRGTWNFGTAGQRSWSDLQNLSKDINLLSSHLNKIYHRKVKGEALRDVERTDKR